MNNIALRPISRPVLGGLDAGDIAALIATPVATGGSAVTDSDVRDVSISKVIDGDFTATGTITGGKFQTDVSPNPRIEITQTLIAGYSDATTKQFYLQASDGKAYFAGGACVIDADGLMLPVGNQQVIYWGDGADFVGAFHAQNTTQTLHLDIVAKSPNPGQFTLITNELSTYNRAYFHMAGGILTAGSHITLEADTVTLDGDVAATGNIRTAGNLGVGNSGSATTLGTVTKRVQIYDAAGASLGFVPVYDTISNTLTVTGASADTYLDSNAPTTNYGSGTDIYVGEYNAGASIARTLIKFDLSGLPADAVITSATLRLYCTADLCDNARTIRVYRTKRAWVVGQATWNIYSTGNNWSTAGGFHTDDCEQTDIGSLALSATEAAGYKDIPLTPTTKTALDLGNGYLIKVDTESNDSYKYNSTDAVANKPVLLIVY